MTQQFLSTRLATQAIDRTVTCSGSDPPSRVGRQAFARPLAQCDRERFLNRILGNIDVTEDADQCGNRSSVLLAEDSGDLGLTERGRGITHAIRPRRPGTDEPRSA